MRRRRLSSKINFPDFDICDNTPTASRLTIEDMCNDAEKDMENRDTEHDLEVEEETPVPTFVGEALVGIKVV